MRRVSGRRTGLGVLAGLALAGVATFAGCSTEGGVSQELRAAADSARDDGIVTGDGSIAVVPPAERGDPVTGLAGQTLDGTELDLAELRGGVVVLNVWGSWCAPCRAEAPELVAAHEALASGDDPVAFVGINARDVSVENALAFERTFGIEYQSLYDPDGSLLLALRGDVPPNAIPSTLVLDPQGRVAARVLGETTAVTLEALVDEVRGAGS